MAIKYTIIDDFDHVIDNKPDGNTFIALRKIQWGELSEKEHLDLRKWFINSNGDEVPGKGVSFITEEGPSTLTKVLLEQGYGSTIDTLRILNNRPDFKTALEIVTNPSSPLNEELEDMNIYYDARSII